MLERKAPYQSRKGVCPARLSGDRRWLGAMVLPALLSVTVSPSVVAQQQLPALEISAPAPRKDLLPTALENPFRVSESQSTSTQTITREEIERLKPQSVFDLLNFATGVVATQGSRKGFSGLTVRGDNNFIWIIDGAYLQNTMASRMLSSLPVMAIEEVQVVRGGNALTMAPMVGTASPGGAPVDGFVIVRTRKPDRDGGTARIALESYDAAQAGVWLGKQLKPEGDAKAYMAGLVSFRDSEGPQRFLDNAVPYNGERHATSGLAKGGFEVAGWSVDALFYHEEGGFQIQNTNSHFTTAGGARGSWYMDAARTDLFVLSGRRSWSSENVTLFNLSRSESNQVLHTANNVAAPVLPGPYSNLPNNNYVTHGNVRHNMVVKGVKLMLGGDYMHWDTPTGQQYYEGIQREEKVQSVFGQAEKSFFNNRLAIDGALRRDRVHVLHGLDYYAAGAAPVGGTSSPLRTYNRYMPAAVFSSVGAAWRLTDRWRLTTRYGEAKQTSSGLNPRPGVVLGNDQQEKFEFGVSGDLNRAFSPSLNYFNRKVKNEKAINGYTYVANNNTTQTCRTGNLSALPAALQPRTTSAVTPCFEQADTLREGLELTARGTLFDATAYRVSWTHFTNLVNTAGTLGSTTPRDIAELSFNHAMGRNSFSGAVKHVSTYSTTVGGYVRVDLGFSRKFRMGRNAAQLALYGRNLTDKRYETSVGIEDPGRVLGAELLVDF